MQVKLTIPPLEVGEYEGFSEDKDIFKRRGFGEELANLIENTDGELSLRWMRRGEKVKARL